MTETKKPPAPPLFWVSEAANDPVYDEPKKPEGDT
jgi:hypothetical protein